MTPTVQCPKADSFCPSWCAHQRPHKPVTMYVMVTQGKRAECHKVDDTCSHVRGRGQVKCVEVKDE